MVVIKSLCRCCALKCRNRDIKKCSKFKLRDKKFKPLVKKIKITKGLGKGMKVFCIVEKKGAKKYV